MKKKMKDKAFASGVTSEIIKEYTQLGLGLDEFLEEAVTSVATVA